MEQILIQNTDNSLPVGVTFGLRQIERFINNLIPLLDMDNEKLVKELESFKKYLVLNHSLREITINNHLGNIKRMLKVLENLNSEKEEVTDYVYEIRNSEKSSSHMCNNINSIEKYMDYKRKLVRYAKPKRIRALITDVLTEAEVNRMIQSCKNIKEKAMFTLLAYSAVRNRSFCNIKLRDVDFGDNTINIRKVKGRKEYQTNISSDCTKVLLKYLEKYPKKLDELLFTTKIKENKYTGSDIRKLVKVIAERAKIDKNVFPHLLRHSLASNMINRGANVILIKNQLGHDWLQSTENYITSFPQRIKSEFEIYKPSYM